MSGEHHAGGRRHRYDLDGLRGVAILLVALYHVFAGRVSGGVDVFLTLSGFFLLISLTSRVGRLPDARFRTVVRGLGSAWLRIARRLLPAAAVVLAGTGVAAWLFLPRSQWEETARQALASLFYVENWHLIANSYDYDAAGLAVSPMQHFWSLSVQGQLFLVVPAVVLTVAWLWRRMRPSAALRGPLLVVLGLAAAGSFGYAVLSVGRDQAVAYYDTGARGWEILAGGLVALSLPWLTVLARRAGVPVRTVVGWLALAMIVSCGFLIDGGSLFPGWATWWPVGATLLLVWAGAEPTRFGADRLLAARPARWLGDHAYSLYLWHWPVLIIYLEYRGRSELGLPGGTAVLVVSLALAVLTKRLVEDPLRQPFRRSLRFPSSVWTRPRLVAAATAFVVGAGVTVGGSYAYIHDIEEAQAAARSDALFVSPDHPGAVALTDPDRVGSYVETDIVPLPALAKGDLPPVRDECASRGMSRSPRRCVIHAGSGPEIAIVGASHSIQLVPALRLIAEQRGFTLVGYLTTQCPWSHAGRPMEKLDALGRSCERYNRELTELLIADQPDLVITTGTRAVRPYATAGDQVPVSFVRAFQEAAAGGLRLVLLRDTPQFAIDVPDCVARQRSTDRTVINAACGVARSQVYADPLPTVDLPGATWLEIADLYCGNEWCNVVEGNVLLYRDKQHITATYARTMAPELDRRLGLMTGWWNGPFRARLNAVE